MPNLLLLAVATVAILSAAAMLTPRAQATLLMSPAAISQSSSVEQARTRCTHRRVCRQGEGCAWRKVCKSW